jgi:hypothetical protein
MGEKGRGLLGVKGVGRGWVRYDSVGCRVEGWGLGFRLWVGVIRCPQFGHRGVF